MEEFGASVVIIGIVATIMGVGAVLHMNALDYEYEAEALIEECQAELPRNQHCILQAVPQQNTGD